MNMRTDFGILDQMPPVALEEMDAIRLMNRVDTKYLTDLETLDKVLEKAREKAYFVFETAGGRIHQYRSLYYDTRNLQMYLDHHNRRLVRQKLRTRSYVSSGVVFLELKNKDNHGRTKKKRIEIPAENYWMMSLNNESVLNWLESRLRYPAASLSPSLETVFSRITLVNPDMTERSTIDFGLRFNNVRRGTSADMGPLVIIEVKQDGNRPSILRDILLDCRVKPVRISKYCIGSALTDSDVKSGRFKRKLILINKMKEQI